MKSVMVAPNNFFSRLTDKRVQKLQNVICFLLLFVTVTMICLQVVSCTTIVSNLSTSLDGIIGSLWNLAKRIFPIGMLFSGIAMCFTRDDRKLAAEKTILIGCLIGIAICYMATKSSLVLDFIQSVIEGTYTTEGG